MFARVYVRTCVRVCACARVCVCVCVRVCVHAYVRESAGDFGFFFVYAGCESTYQFSCHQFLVFSSSVFSSPVAGPVSSRISLSDRGVRGTGYELSH